MTEEVFHFIPPTSKALICNLRSTGRMWPAEFMSAARGSSGTHLTHALPSERRITFFLCFGELRTYIEIWYIIFKL